MKKYTRLSQLIVEQAEDAKFKIEGRPEDNLLNGLVLKRFKYSYTYPKNSPAIITPKSILDYIMSATDGDANQIKTVINSLASPAAVGASADPSTKAGLLGGKNQVEGHIYIFKNITDDSVNSVNPDQLLGKIGNGLTSFQVLSTPRTGGESIQQNLAKIINANKTSTGSAGNSGGRTAGGRSSGTGSSGKLTMMELNVILPEKPLDSPTEPDNGAAYYFKKVVNGLFKNESSPDVLLKSPIKYSVTGQSFTKGVSTISIPEDKSGKIEAGLLVTGPGIPPNTRVTKKSPSATGGLTDISISNPTYSDETLPTFGFYDNYIFPGTETPVMSVISLFFSSQPKLNSIVPSQVKAYTPAIKAAFTEILNNSGDPDYKVDASYNLDELTKTQLVSIMTVWLVYAVNNGIIPAAEIKNANHPTLTKYVEAIIGSAKSAAAAAVTSTPTAPSAMQQASIDAINQKRANRLAGRPTIENVDELMEILMGVGYTKSDLFKTKTDPNSPSEITTKVDNDLVSPAADAYEGASGWKVNKVTDNKNDAGNGDVILEFDTSNIGAFKDGGGAKLYTPDFKGIHSALGFLRQYIRYKQGKSPISGQPTMNPVPTSAELKAQAARETTYASKNKPTETWKQKGPNQAEIDTVKKGFGWDSDLETAITFYRNLYYKNNPPK